MSNSPLPQFDVTTFESQIFWLVLFFIAFYLYIKLVVSPYFTAETVSRQTYIDNALSEIKKLKKKANYLSEDHAGKLHAAHLRAKDILLNAEKNSSKKFEKMKEKLSLETQEHILKLTSSLDEKYVQIDGAIKEKLDDLVLLASKKVNLS